MDALEDGEVPEPQLDPELVLFLRLPCEPDFVGAVEVEGGAG